ncbi:MAG: bifunctional diguanylate cyclase/phosphodiesterase [Lachnospiraceae bacterium]|nr:bifunctional diguanylate cyclase/phosphodiesterase [Lachnospiraceae bacterium]
MEYSIGFTIAALIITAFGAAALFSRIQIIERIQMYLICMISLVFCLGMFDLLTLSASESMEEIANAFAEPMSILIGTWIMYLILCFIRSFAIRKSQVEEWLMIPALVQSSFTFFIVVMKWAGVSVIDLYVPRLMDSGRVIWTIYWVLILLFATKNYMYYGVARMVLMMVILAIGISLTVLGIKTPDESFLTLCYAITVTIIILLTYYISGTYDPLTNIFSEKAFFRVTRAMLLSAPKQEKFLLIRCDIRHFGEINEWYSEQIGDEVLREFGRRIHEMANKRGTFGRIGADDFVLCLPKEIFHEDLETMNLEDFLKKPGLTHKLSFCFGVYEINDVKTPISSMCSRAEYAMRTIQGKYHEHYAYCDEAMEQQLAKEQEMEHEMFQALDEEQFVVYYQPIVDLKTRKIVSLEALVRWNHPTKGLIPPGDFIPLFERNGFLRELDEYVLLQTCLDMDNFRKMGHRIVPVSVNMSRIEMDVGSHLSRVQMILNAYNIPPEMIHAEITESAFMENTDQLMLSVHEMQNAGFLIYMDDFGSGYSSLNVFKNMPVDVLKLDMRFLEDMEDSEKGRLIVVMVLDMAKQMNLPVIVEGVETEAQAEFISAHGATMAQGYLFYKPLPRLELEEILQREDEQ